MVDEEFEQEVIEALTNASSKFGIPIKDIVGRCRRRDIVQARHAVWRTLNVCGYGYRRIARKFGVDVAAVARAVKKGNINVPRQN